MTRKEKIAGWILGLLLFAGTGYLIHQAYLGEELDPEFTELEALEAVPELTEEEGAELNEEVEQEVDESLADEEGEETDDDEAAEPAGTESR
jgi:hypothetical protein